MKEVTTFIIGMLSGLIILILAVKLTQNNIKPISYPEEIQAVRAGDTLYVSSVSDSIYIGFKP